MATVTRKAMKGQRQFGGVPYGNLTCLRFTLELDASGIWQDGNQATAVIANDVLRLGVLPAGFEILDSMIVISTAGAATSTGDFGFAYTDGVDDAAVPQDDDYFAADQALSAAATVRQDTDVAPVILPKDAYLNLVNKVAAQDGDMVVDVMVLGIIQGPK